MSRENSSIKDYFTVNDKEIEFVIHTLFNELASVKLSSHIFLAHRCFHVHM